MAERVAVITGAASGIGLATARELLEEDAGTQLIGVDVAARPPELPAERCDWVEGDVAGPGTWEEVKRAALALDPLGAEWFVPCAGIQVIKPFAETGIEDFERMFAVNVLGVVRGIQALVPAMVDRGHGAIAVVASITSETVVDGLSAYATSKAALLQAVRSAALEYASRGIRINAVCPGFIDTPLLRGHLETLDDPEAARAGAARRTPTGQILTPAQVAGALCFLLSERASGLSGASVMVDGGLLTTFDFDSSAARD